MTCMRGPLKQQAAPRPALAGHLIARGRDAPNITDYMRKPPDPKCWCHRSLIGTDSNYTSVTGNPAIAPFKNAAVLPNDVWILPPTGAPRPLVSDLPNCKPLS